MDCGALCSPAGPFPEVASLGLPATWWRSLRIWCLEFWGLLLSEKETLVLTCLDLCSLPLSAPIGGTPRCVIASRHPSKPFSSMVSVEVQPCHRRLYVLLMLYVPVVRRVTTMGLRFRFFLLPVFPVGWRGWKWKVIKISSIWSFFQSVRVYGT